MRSAVVAASLVSAVAASWGPGSQGPPGAPAQGPPGGSWGNGPEGDSWTTEVVTAFTTFCPEATQITHGGETYTATEATTFTITNCPGGCTISYPATSWGTDATTWAETTPVETSPVATTPAESTPWGYTTEATTAPTTWAETSPVETAPVATTPAPAPYPVANATTWATSAVGSTASAYPSSGVVPATGGAAQLSAAGAAIAAVFGLVAAL